MSPDEKKTDEETDSGELSVSGVPVIHTDAELDNLATITPAVIRDAMASAMLFAELDALLRARRI